MIELALENVGGRIVQVASTLALPGYLRLLRRLLVGSRLEGMEEVFRHLTTYVRGPLLKPTIAALTKAVASVEQGRPAPV